MAFRGHRGKTRSNAKLNFSEDAFIIKQVSIISDFVNWIRIM